MYGNGRESPEPKGNYSTDSNGTQEKRAALYVRVSTDEQARHRQSIGDQLQALRAWARENGYIAPLEYLDEGFSARKSYKTRPAFRRLIEDIKADKISVIAFVKLDRWMRSVKDYYAVQTILDEHKVDWIAITESYTTLTTQGRLMLNLRLSIAEMEADNTGDRIRFTFAQKKARGELTSSAAPFGYKVVKSKPIIDKEQEPAVRAFWKEYLESGSFTKSLHAIQDAGIMVNRSRARRMLAHADQYAGLIHGVEAEPYITKKQAERVLAQKGKRPRKSDIVHLFSGMIYCSECKHRMSAHISTRHNKDGDVKYVSYLCKAAEDRLCKQKICIIQSKIERQLLERLEDELEQYTIEIKTRTAQQKPKQDPAIKISELQTKRKRLIDLYLEGTIQKQDFEHRRQDIDDEIARLSVEPEPEKFPDPNKIKAMLPQNWKEIYEELTDDRKRKFWFQLIDRIEVNADRTISFSFVQ